MIHIPITHCQRCATLIGLYNTVPTVCNECDTAHAELEQEHAEVLANRVLYPERRQYTALEKRKIEIAVKDAARADIRTAYSMLRKLTAILIAREEYLKAAFLRDLRRSLHTAP